MTIKNKCLVLMLALVTTGCFFSHCKQGTAAVREGYIVVPGGKVWYRITGEKNRTPILLLHGGPGYPAFNSFKALEDLADERLVVYYDQLGGGHSDHVTDTALWKIERFVAELHAVRTALGLKQMHIFGHSWGGALALEYYLTYPDSGIQSLILAGPLISTAKWMDDARQLLATLPDSVQAIIQQHQAAGTTGSPEYLAATQIYYGQFLVRVKPYPPGMAAEESVACLSAYQTMWGPNEFYATGTLINYDRSDDLGKIMVPTLFTAGKYDEARPETIEEFRKKIHGAELVIFENSAHMTMVDQPLEYTRTIRNFLDRVEKAK